uniref:Uncharacterized protein n=1 Tax=Tetranychus urticae TaxID=32264 RepID=T1KJJ6_TETUR
MILIQKLIKEGFCISGKNSIEKYS